MYICDGILFSLKNEGNFAICYDINEQWIHDIKMDQIPMTATNKIDMQALKLLAAAATMAFSSPSP